MSKKKYIMITEIDSDQIETPISVDAINLGLPKGVQAVSMSSYSIPSVMNHVDDIGALDVYYDVECYLGNDYNLSEEQMWNISMRVAEEEIKDSEDRNMLIWNFAEQLGYIGGE